MHFAVRVWLVVLSSLVLHSFSLSVGAKEYVGSSQCVSCHEVQAEAWKKSHHSMAMAHANEKTVRGDFNSVTLESNERVGRFYKKDGAYWVAITDSVMGSNDYRIQYTFGVEPLQQYMVEFEDGRVQLIPFAWDSRSLQEGGQRWFDLYPDQTQLHQEFHWLNTGQNWNYMCADCHSTNVKKGFDLKSNEYETTFSEIAVGCEACHGPASGHLKWLGASGEKELVGKGFERALSKVVAGVKDPTTTAKVMTHRLSSAGKESQQVLVCAQCHSRHVQISDSNYVANNALGDRYVLNLIGGQRYYPDGQVYDENYVYGSFLQSKMHRQGVVCSNCHDPHSGGLVLPAETLCLQCHQDSVYAVEAHHHHEGSSSGAQCVNCHMPETTYMEVDKRRDHSWHIPRPEWSMQMGVPDVCLSCHEEKTSEWSRGVVSSWLSNKPAKGVGEKHFAPVFAAIDMGYEKAINALSHVAQDHTNASIIRASALERMTPFIGTNTIIAIARGLKSEDEHIRIGAVRGAEGVQGEERWRLISPLLNDEVLAVRVEAVGALISLWSTLSDDQRELLQSALDDYMEVQLFNSDRGFSHVNRGYVFVYQKRFGEAEAAFKDAIRVEPYFSGGYMGLSDLYRALGREQNALVALEEGSDLIPGDPNLLYGQGLAHIRLKNQSLAIKYLRAATQAAPDNAQYHFVYSLSLQKTKPQEAEVSMANAYRVSGSTRHLYALCEMKVRHVSDGAEDCLSELAQLVPEEAVNRLRAQLNGPK